LNPGSLAFHVDILSLHNPDRNYILGYFKSHQSFLEILKYGILEGPILGLVFIIYVNPICHKC
jgi:hypothetical protein